MLQSENEKTESTPLVSVVLPVYNGEKYIEKAVESMLSQTYKNIELIVMDDGSSDNTTNLLSGFKDPRLKVFSRENKGLVYTLNEGIEKSTGDFIARMDADDIAEPKRIEKQLDYLLKNSDVALSCTSIIYIDENDKVTLTEKNKSCFEFTADRLIFGNPICHPTVMFNMNLLDKKDILYDSRFLWIEDFELWCRIISKYKAVRLPENLLKYRVHSESVNGKNTPFQREEGIKILKQLFERPNSRALHYALNVLHRHELTSFKTVRILLAGAIIGSMKTKDTSFDKRSFFKTVLSKAKHYKGF